MSEDLSHVLADTLSRLGESIEKMEQIVRQLEAGETDWDESIQLLGEANELALSSSKRLEQAVQDVIYGAPRESQGAAQDEDGEG